MKKMLSTAVIAIIISMVSIDTVDAKRATPSTAKRATNIRIGKHRAKTSKSVREDAAQIQQIVNNINETSNQREKAQMQEDLNALTADLLKDLQERTWAQDLGVKKYTPEQIEAAQAKLVNLLNHQKSLEKSIRDTAKQIKDMSTSHWIFWNKANEPKEEEQYNKLKNDLIQLKKSLADTNKAIKDQSVIAGKEYSTTLRMAITAIGSATAIGASYLIDQYAFKGAGTEYVGKKAAAGKQFVKGEYAEYQAKGALGYGKAKYEATKNAIAAGADKLADITDSFAAKISNNRHLQRLANQATAEQEKANDLATALEDAMMNFENESVIKDYQKSAEEQQKIADNAAKKLEDAVLAAKPAKATAK